MAHSRVLLPVSVTSLSQALADKHLQLTVAELNQFNFNYHLTDD